ncbi:MAG: hypothetical protein ABFR33_10835, partial [Verrucomicrobiota bacterium]
GAATACSDIPATTERMANHGFLNIIHFIITFQLPNNHQSNAASQQIFDFRFPIDDLWVCDAFNRKRPIA